MFYSNKFPKNDDGDRRRCRRRRRAWSSSPSGDQLITQYPFYGRKFSSGLQYQDWCPRVAALQKLGRTTVKAVVRSGLTDEAAFKLSLDENQHREPLGDLDRAYAIVEYRKRFGKTVADAMEMFELQKSQTLRLCKLVTFPETLQHAVADDIVPTTHAIKLMGHLGTDTDEATLTKWIERTSAGKMSVAELERALHKESPKPTRGEAIVAAVSLYRTVEGKGSTTPTVQLRPRKFSRDTLTAEERHTAIRDLEALIALLR